MNAHSFTHAHTHMHTHTRAHTDTHTHTYIHTHTHTHTCSPMHNTCITHAWTHTHGHGWHVWLHSKEQAYATCVANSVSGVCLTLYVSTCVALSRSHKFLTSLNSFVTSYLPFISPSLTTPPSPAPPHLQRLHSAVLA